MKKTSPLPTAALVRDYALLYHKFGWSVIPLIFKQKKPRVKWERYKTERASRAEVEAWFSERSNIAIVTGRVSDLLVLDFDEYAAYEKFTREFGEFETPAVRTRRGIHLYFRHPGGEIPTVPSFLPGCDLKGEGGYVVAPPSVHPSGHVYEWILSPANVSLADFPEALIPLLEKRNSLDLSATGLAWSDEKRKEIARMLLERALEMGKPGNRNNAGFWLARQLRDYGFDIATAERIMREYAARVEQGEKPYTVKEALASLRSAYKYPRMHPQPVIVEEERKSLYQEINALPASEEGIAQVFKLLYSDDFRYCTTTGEWYVWNGSRWARDIDEIEISRAVRRCFEEKKFAALAVEQDKKRLAKILSYCENITLSKINNVISLARIFHPFPVSAEKFDRNKFLVSFRNGTLDLLATAQNILEGEMKLAFYPPRREDYITRGLDYDLDPETVAPRWWQFVEEIFESRADLIEWVQRAVGYALTGSTIEQVFFILYGTGCNGKSTFLEVLREVLEDYAGVVKFAVLQEEERGEAPSPVLYSLRGKRFIIASEPVDRRALASAKLKALTGEDSILARKPFQREPIEFRICGKFFLAVNTLPPASDFSPGFWRRVRVIPFTANFEGREDRMLKQKLLNEKAGIMNWVIQGALRYLVKMLEEGSGLGECKEVNRATEDYRETENWFERFISECFESTRSPADRVSASEIFEIYERWADENGEQKISKTRLGRLLGQRFERKTERGKRVYLGLRRKEI